MNPYWVEFEDETAGTVNATSEEDALMKAAMLHGEPVKASILPYGADPRLDDASRGGDFCFTPEQCKGRTSCPRRYACSE